MLKCCGKEAKTKHIYRTLDPEWQERVVLRLPLDADEGAELKVTVMDWDQSAHDVVGLFGLALGSKADPFPTVQDKYINHNISMAGFLSTATFEGWFELTSSEGKLVQGLKGQKSLVDLHIQHIHEVRDVRFRPTQEFIEACKKGPRLRSRRDIRFMTHECVTQMPCAALLSSRLVSSLCRVGRLKEWKKYDVAQLQNTLAAEDSLQLVLSGTFNLYAQSQGPNAAMYRVLKGRSFGPETSFGPQIGWCGPGEGCGQAALLMHEGESSTSVCMSDDGGMTLLIDRRHCERIMEQFSRKEAGYSPAVHGQLLAQEPPKAPSALNTLHNFFRQTDSRLFHGVSDGVMSHILEECSLVKMKAGDVLELDKESQEFYLVLYGTLSAHACVRSPVIRHFMPIQGECVDMLGPGSTFGACAYTSANLRAREYAELIKIHRTTLIETYGPDEPFLKVLVCV